MVRAGTAFVLGSVVMVAGLGGGYKSEAMSPYAYEDGHPKQKYEFKEVKR